MSSGKARKNLQFSSNLGQSISVQCPKFCRLDLVGSGSKDSVVIRGLITDNFLEVKCVVKLGM